MKNIFVCLIFLLCTVGCNNKSIKTISFKPLLPTEFTEKSFAALNNKLADSLKHVHDSCMGFSFNANVILIRSIDSFSLGDIVNKQSLKPVNTLKDLGVTMAQLISKFNVLTNPCYNKNNAPVSPLQILGENFYLQLPNTDKAIIKEINDGIANTKGTELQAGNWVYLDVKSALQNILDTAQTPSALHYKQNLLDTSNMILTATESLTDVSLVIHSANGISKRLQSLLESKPAVALAVSNSSIQLSYIDNNNFQIRLNGFFPLVGEFMKAVLN